MTALQHHRRSVPDSLFHSLVLSLVTCRLRKRNTRRTSCVPTPSTSVSAQGRRQTDTSIFSVRARHTDAARPSLAAVFGTHPFQAGCAHFRCLHGLAPRYLSDYIQRVRRFQPSPSPAVVSSQLVIRRTWLPTVGDRALPVVESCLWNSLRQTSPQLQRCFLSEPSQNSSLFPIISFLPVFDFSVCTPYLALFYSSHCNVV